VNFALSRCLIDLSFTAQQPDRRETCRMVFPSAAPSASPHQIWRRALDGLCGFLFLAVVYAGAAILMIVALACAYTLKRAAGLDVVPGVDMLPDEEIEAAIQFVLDALF
jgi:hypothetical protein